MFKIRHNVYLDNNATTHVSSKVLRKMNRVLRQNFGNPSSLYKVAISSAIILDESRAIVAKTIMADPSEIYFTGSATEANNNIIKSLAEHHFPVKNKIISSPIEHASVISTLQYLAEKGFIIEYIPVDNKGHVNVGALSDMIDHSTLLICCMLANNETGVIQDIKQITKIAHSKQVPVFSDCVQALGKIPVNVKDLDIDYASISAHKIHGPKGAGALYVKNGNFISPFVHGGHQENGIRAGTESIHNIAGLAEACKCVPFNLSKAQKIESIKRYFIRELKKIKPDIILNSPEDSTCLPNTVNIVFPGINNAYFMATLDYFGMAVSAGSACNTQSNEPSHVLKAIGITDDEARESIRFSLGTNISKFQIRYVLEVIRQFVNGELPPIGMLEPKLLNKEMIDDNNTFIVDVRFWHDRLLVKSIPNAHEISFFSYKRYFKHIPREKNIILVCQTGFNAPIVAYEMKLRGYKNVSFLMLGIVGWKQANPALYESYAGTNIKKL
jgi:cysteine desulfurase